MSCVGFWMTGTSILAACLLISIFCMALYIVFNFELFDAKCETGNWDITTIYRGSKLAATSAVSIIELRLCIDLSLQRILSRFGNFGFHKFAAFRTQTV